MAALAVLSPVHLHAQDDVDVLIRDALEYHPSLRAKKELRGAAEAEVKAAKREYWPTPSLGVERISAGDGASSTTGSNYVATIRLQQPLWTGGRLAANVARARANAAIADSDAGIARQQLTFELLQAFAQALVAEDVAAAYRRSVAGHERLMAMVERRSQEGVSARSDVQLAISRLETVRGSLASAEAERDTAIVTIQALVGRRVTLPSMEEAVRKARFTMATDELLDSALLNAPSVAKAKGQKAAAAAERRQIRARNWPEIYGRAERQYGNYSQSVSGPQDRVYVGFSTSFGGGFSNFAASEAANSREVAAESEIAAAELLVERDVRETLTALDAATNRRRVLELAQRTSGEVSDSWERQFLGGRKQWQDLMNAAREQTQTEVQLAEAKGSEFLADWRLNILTQGVDSLGAAHD